MWCCSVQETAQGARPGLFATALSNFSAFANGATANLNLASLTAQPQPCFGRRTTHGYPKTWLPPHACLPHCGAHKRGRADDGPTKTATLAHAEMLTQPVEVAVQRFTHSNLVQKAKKRHCGAAEPHGCARARYSTPIHLTLHATFAYESHRARPVIEPRCARSGGHKNHAKQCRHTETRTGPRAPPAQAGTQGLASSRAVTRPGLHTRNADLHADRRALVAIFASSAASNASD
jgi:hypothetical protein